MDDKAFSKPIVLQFGNRTVTVGSAKDGADLLMTEWPSERGPRAEDALDTCLKVLDGHRSTIDAETAMTAAAREAGVLASLEEEPPSLSADGAEPPAK